MRDGKVVVVRNDLHSLSVASPRTGLKKQGFGTYVVLVHEDGSTSLYAHLAPPSVAGLTPGQRIKAGETIGKSDSSGAVTGPHLHVELTSGTDPFDHRTKLDIDPCMPRRGWITLESYLKLFRGVCEAFVDGKSLGTNPPGEKTRLEVSLRPGKHLLKLVAKSIAAGKKVTCSTEFADPFTTLDASGADLGPGFAEELSQGESAGVTLFVH
jgi:murein DD-endopeptidase MepM/ murein hydrolase activator NlpD